LETNDVKQVIVMRKDLKNTEGQKVRTGKLCAQAAHSSLGVILDKMRNGQTYENYQPEIINGEYTMTLKVKVNSALDQWLRGCFKKICLCANSNEELLQIYQNAKETNLPVVLITDNGLTEFNGVHTNTCIAIGPAFSKDIDKITGHLKTL
jgi:peptidyl-tRNA hydrolase